MMPSMHKAWVHPHPALPKRKRREKKRIYFVKISKIRVWRALPLPRLRRDLPVAEVLPEQPWS